MQNKLICPKCHYEESFHFALETYKAICPKCKSSFMGKNAVENDSTRPLTLSMVNTDTVPTDIKKLSNASQQLKESLECDLRAANLLSDFKKSRLQHTHEHKLILPLRRQNSFITSAQRRYINRAPWIAISLIVIFMFICGLYLGLNLPFKL